MKERVRADRSTGRDARSIDMLAPSDRIPLVSGANPQQSKFRFNREIVLLDEHHTGFVDVQGKAEVLS